MTFRDEDAITALRAKNDELWAKIDEMNAKLAEGFSAQARQELVPLKEEKPAKEQPTKKVSGGLRYRTEDRHGQSRMEDWVLAVTLALILAGICVASAAVSVASMRWLWAVSLFLVLFACYIIYRALPREEIKTP